MSKKILKRFFGKSVLSVLLILFNIFDVKYAFAQINLEDSSILGSIVRIACLNEKLDMSEGSGVIVTPDGYIVSNQHVVSPNLYGGRYDCIGLIVSEDNNYEPDYAFNIDFFSTDITNDFAFGKIQNSFSYKRNVFLVDVKELSEYPYLKLNEESSVGDIVYAMGYPDITDGALNITKGVITSKRSINDIEYIISDVNVSFGNSGGALVNDNGELVGLTSSVSKSELSSATNIIGAKYFERRKKFFEDVIKSNPSNRDFFENTTEFIDHVLSYNDKSTKSEISTVDNELVNRLKGRILLRVEQYGEAWYLDPVTSKRYYMKDGQTAYEMLRAFGLGITTADLKKLKEGKRALVNQLKGRIVIQVEAHGEAYYVHPVDGSVHYMKDGLAAYQIMRELSLGISNLDLNKIPIGKMVKK